MKTLLDTLDLGLIVVDSAGLITVFNAWMVRFSGLSEAEVLGRPFFEVFPSAICERLPQALQAAIDSGHFAVVSAAIHGAPITRANGLMPSHSVRIVPMTEGACAPYSVAIQVTDAARFARVDGALRATRLRLSELKRELRRVEASRRELMQLDPITGLFNRSQLREDLAASIHRCLRSGQKGVLFHIDVDHFKAVNESIGRVSANKVLREVAHRLDGILQRFDSVARVGADEFGLLFEGVDSEAEVTGLTEQLHKVFATPFVVNLDEVFLTVSVGATIYPRDGSTADILLKNAEAALYKVRAEGGNGLRFFFEDMTTETRRVVKLRSALHRAAERSEFHLVNQPQVDLRRRKTIGMEALLRWTQPGVGLVPPGQFIGVLEESGLINRVGAWVIQESCRQVAEWRRKGLEVRVSVNVSARQVREGRLVEIIKDALESTPVEGEALELELTESLLIEDLESVRSTLSTLRDMGVRIAIDDFGTGYSSLMYLRRLPVTSLKVDRAFVKNIAHDPDDEAICSTIIHLGETLGLDVLAEGVEEHDQLDLVLSHGCSLVQGFFFSKGLPPEQAEQWLRRDLSLLYQGH